MSVFPKRKFKKETWSENKQYVQVKNWGQKLKFYNIMSPRLLGPVRLLQF